MKEKFQIEQGMRVRIARFLPKALEIALAAYKFSSVQKDKDGGAMKKHQDACKVAIAHVQLLIKLAQWVDGPERCGAVAQEDLGAMIEAAQMTLSDHSGG